MKIKDTCHSLAGTDHAHEACKLEAGRETRGAFKIEAFGNHINIPLKIEVVLMA